MAALRRVVLLCRDVDASAAWYSLLGLSVTTSVPGAYARLEAAPPPAGAQGQGGGSGGPAAVALDLQAASREAELCTGYSPMLHFEVPSGLDTLVPQLLMAGGRLDGAIQHTEVAQVAVLRSPDGHFVSVAEPNALPSAAPLR